MQWRRYFVTPTPSSDGSLNISVWGQKVVELLNDDDDVTIFSYAMPECNEAIVIEAGAILKGKTDEEKSQEFKSLEAKAMLARAWDRVNKERAKLEKAQAFFYVPDFFKSSSSRSDTPIGDF